MPMTITEALAELKTLAKRIQKKQQTIGQYLVRQEKFKDPLVADGGSRAFIVSERQSIGDLENRIVLIRSAISAANSVEQIAVGDMTKTLSEWLIWKREVAPNRQQFLASLRQSIGAMRLDAARKGLTVTTGESGTKADDLIINLNEIDLAKEIESLEQVLGDLDGQLSLKNATVLLAGL